MVTFKETQSGLVISLAPNRSATWAQTMFVIGSIGVISLSIAIFWAFQGAWMILPFAGLEITLLVFLAYKVCAKTYHIQILYLDKEEIRLEWGATYPKRKWLFPRSSTNFIITRPNHSLSPSKIEITHNTSALRLGELLNKADIDQTIKLLRKAGLSMKYKGTTQTIALDNFPHE